MTRSRWLVRGLLLFVLAFANLNDIRAEEAPGGEAPGLWSPDVLPNALFAWTVIKEHDVDYDVPFERDRKSTRLNSSHIAVSRMPSSA